MCLIVDDTKVLQSNREKITRQELFIFNATWPGQNGIIFKNNEVTQGKYISSVLPITKSNYVILGFTTKAPWTTTSPKVLLRLDYTDTKKQFEYTVPDTTATVSCYKLLYISYSKYFLASFSGNNGVLVYDFTKSSQAHQRVFRPPYADFNEIDYLEKSKVVLWQVQDFIISPATP